jgi:hypothetical protein
VADGGKYRLLASPPLARQNMEASFFESRGLARSVNGTGYGFPGKAYDAFPGLAICRFQIILTYVQFL